MPDSINFVAVTACGECGTGCAKKVTGHCRGCPIHKCTRQHPVQFCVLCAEFPCKWLGEKVTWNPNITEHLAALAARYHKKE